MKRLMLFISMIAIAIFITACGDDNNENNASNDVTNNEEQNEDANTADENEDTNASDDTGNNQNDATANEDNTESNLSDDMQAKMDELDYAEIEIEVDYGKNTEYEAEIEQDEGEPIKAKMEDEVNDEFLNGEEAFNKLYPMVKKLSIDKDTDKDTAIKDVLNIFNLDEDYDAFELEITFHDGSELEFEDK